MPCSGLQMLIVLLCLVELGGCIRDRFAKLQNLLLILLIALAPALELSIKGADLITKLTLLICAFIQLAS